MSDVVCIGMACTDILIRGADLSTPFVEESKKCEETAIGIGGDATNEAIIMSRLGVNTKLLTGLGDDSIADFIETALKKENIDLSDVNYTEGSRSLMNVIVVHPDGQRNFINTGVMPPAAQFSPNLDAVRSAKIVSLASIMTPPLNTPENVRAVLTAAKEGGATVCADIIYNKRACSLADLGDCLKNVDYIFPNQDEASGLTGATDIDEMADILLGYGIKNVIIKVGKDGSFVKNANERFYIPCVGPRGIDTTGAGDNFAAGFITALNEGKSLRDCCLFASATAGLACQFMGANTGVKSKEQVEKFLKENMPKGEF